MKLTLNHPIHDLKLCARVASAGLQDCDCGYTPEGSPKPGDVIAVTKGGLHRVYLGKDEPGFTFLVDTVTEGLVGPVVHVRDYRRPDDGTTWNICSIGADGYRIVHRDGTPLDSKWQKAGV